MVGLIYATSAGAVKFARSEDSGLSFTNVAIQGPSANETNASFPVVADAGGGHLVATWQNMQSESSSIAYSESRDWGESWSPPRTLVESGTSVYPWIAARGSKIAISLYRTTAVGTPESVPAGAQWFETYLESTDGGASFSEPVEVDAGLPAKQGPICLEGVECSENRDLGDFQSVAIDPEGRADLAWVHAGGEESSEALFTRQAAGSSVGQAATASTTTGAVTGGTRAKTGPVRRAAGAPGAGGACVARARQAAAKRLAAARHMQGRAKLRSIRASRSRERKAIARCRSRGQRSNSAAPSGSPRQR